MVLPDSGVPLMEQLAICSHTRKLSAKSFGAEYGFFIIPFFSPLIDQPTPFAVWPKILVTLSQSRCTNMESS